MSADIRVGHPKVAITVPVTALPFECVVAEPAPQPPVTLMLVAASGVRLSVTIAGKTFRRCIKSIVADGPIGEGQFALIQGRLGIDGILDEAGLSYTPKPVATSAPEE
ncbi:hypothetical protein V5F50_19750 [Xanthobacter sp. V13C-7B]|uniref:hypothetical protein n=1 Tax=Xanthobacter variabilis TaxID=3119932 RepID=UPI00372B3F32